MKKSPTTLTGWNSKYFRAWLITVTTLVFICEFLVFWGSWNELGLAILMGTCFGLLGGGAAFLATPYTSREKKRISQITTTITALFSGYAVAKIVDPIVNDIFGNGMPEISLKSGALVLIAFTSLLSGFFGTYVVRMYVYLPKLKAEEGGDSEAKKEA